MMNFLRTLQVTKTSLLRCTTNVTCNNIVKLSCTPNIYQNQRQLSTTLQNACSSKVEAETKFLTASNKSLIERFIEKIPFLNVWKHKLTVSGYLLYESVADKINYSEFFDEFMLPDTFYSWFVITEIHVWLLMVRCMAECDDGRIMRNAIVQAMWSDVGIRAKKLGAHNPSGVRAQIQQLNEQFQAALIAYDEGLQGDDKILAGAIWRRVYQQKEASPEHLECMVRYIRKQALFLDNISREDLFSQKKINWESLRRV